MDTRPPRTAISVFTGAGGLDLGLHRACGVEPVVYIERDADAAAVLVARMGEKALASAPIWDDATTFRAEHLAEATGSATVDLVCGGSPCPEFSLANSRRQGLDSERGALFFQLVRIAEECSARFFFWENVGGATGSLPRICDYLARYGWHGAWTSLRASDVDATHERRRIFLLAHRDGPGLEERETLGGDGETECAPPQRIRVGVDAHPPPPDDVDGWRRVLAARPDLAPIEPLIHGVADGLAGRVDATLREARIRMCGNGAHPGQVALAWRILWDALMRR